MTQRVVNYTYGTGNPVLPDGSIDVRDGIDNLQSMDVFMNAPEDTYNQRDGEIVRTVAGMNNEFDAQILNMGFTRVGTFAAGATLTNPRQTLLWDVADGGDGQEYGWSGTFPKVVPATSTPASTGGISVGAWISRFDPELRIQVREVQRRSYAEAGYNLVAGSFEAGGTLVNTNDVLLQERTGKAFSGPAGAVAAGTNPASGGFVDRSDELLRATYFSGPVRSLSQSQFSISAAMDSATQTAKVQGFIDSFIPLGGCAVIDQEAIIDDIGVYARSGVDIRFTNEAKFTKEPTSAQGYGMLYVSGITNANIYSPRLIGDKYNHLADSGEFGMGLRIIGECDNVIIHNPICDEMWGDGIYIGADTSNRYPSGAGVTIYNPVCRKNRRQGISYTGGVVRIIDPICEDTKSSDSRFTLSAGPHAGIDIEPNNADPVIDVEISNPKTARNDGDGILFTPFFIKTAHNLKVKITNHVDDGSRHSFRVLADNDLFSGFVHYNGFGQNNKLCALYIDAWKKCAECDVDIYMRTKAWGRDTSSAKFGAAYAWGSSLTTDGGIKIRLSCVDTADKLNIAYHLGPTDLNLQITTDNGYAVSLISSGGSFIDVKVDGPFKKQMTPVNVGYTDFFNSFQVDGAGGNRSIGFESSWFTNMRDGDIVEVDAKNCAQLLIQTTASQDGQGGAIIRQDGTAGNYRITAGPQKVINVRFVKYGYFMMIDSISGGTGVNA
ncbi:MAG: hypothetical protein ACRC9H_11365 [Aeromonas veronii]